MTTTSIPAPVTGREVPAGPGSPRRRTLRLLLRRPSTVVALGFVLFMLTFIVLSIARLMLRRLNKRDGN